MSLKNNYLFILASVLLFSSCHSHFYVPEQVNSLQLSKKNDLKISANGFYYKKKTEREVLFREKQYQYFNFQIGYSPIKHLGIFAQHFRINGFNSIFSPPFIPEIKTNLGEGMMTNAALGGYYFLNKKKPVTNDSHQLDSFKKTGWLFEVYAGYGEGHLNHSVNNSFSSFHFDLRKHYLQTGIHWQMKKLDISYQLVIGSLDFFNGFVQGPFRDDFYTTLQRINEEGVSPYSQHNFNIQKRFKVGSLYISIATFTINPTTRILNPPSQLIYLGVNLNISHLFKMIKKRKPYNKNLN